jgi:hypothetical protein
VARAKVLCWGRRRCDAEAEAEEVSQLLPRVRIDMVRAKDCGYDRAGADTEKAKDLGRMRGIETREPARQLARAAGMTVRETQLVSGFADAGRTVQETQLEHIADSLLVGQERRL